MTENLKTVINTIAQLTPDEQFELIATVSLSLQKRFQPRQFYASIQEFAPSNFSPAGIKRTPPIQNLSQLKADFWPEDETADDVNNYLEQQREEDLLRERDEYGIA
jgi:hypothetical protein